MKDAFLILSGVSGVGKSSIMDGLKEFNFRYVSPYMTRSLRDGETDKISISPENMRQKIDAGDFVAVNKLYGNVYGTPLEDILQYRDEGFVPMLDYPIKKVGELRERLNGKIDVVCIYISPPSLIELKRRLGDGRDKDSGRYSFAIKELSFVERGDYDGEIDMRLVNGDLEKTIGKIIQ